MVSRIFRALSVLLVTIGVLSACGGSHSALPGLPGGNSAAPDARLRVASVAAANGDTVAINAGGAAATGFSADEDYGSGTYTYTSTKTIDTSAIADPAPQAVYQTQRTGKTVTYTIPGLSAGATYSVRLSFAELFWTAAKQRVFNIAVNGTTVASNFDIVATAGAPEKAVKESFTASASSSGTITVKLTAVTDNATINALEIAVPAGGGVYINAGGAAVDNFAADQDYAPGGYAYTGSGTIDTSLVSNPAPQGVYLTQRVNTNVSYTIANLSAGAAYTVRLDFAELYFTSAGQRVFNISLNGKQVLTGLDIYAVTGAKNKALAETFTTTASSTGTIAVTLNATTNYAVVNGIEIASGTGPTSPPTATPSPVATGFDDWASYGYDTQRSGFNPNTTPISPASLSRLHLGWQTAVHGSTKAAQPIVVSNVAGHAALLIIASFAEAQAYDALTGKRVWSTGLPVQDVQDCGIAGISGTAAYDKGLSAIFMAAGNGKGAPNHTLLYRLDVATGKITGSVDVTPTLVAGEANKSGSGITFANGRIYLGTGSDCEGTATGKYPSWRGRVVSVDPSSMTLLSTFYTTYGQHGAYAPLGNFGGGGVWGWGGVSADPSGNVYVASGNAETADAAKPQKVSAPFVVAPNEQAGYAEQLVKLSSNLSSVEGANYPGFNFTIGYGDLDYSGTPVIYQPPVTSGCGVLSATQGKGGKLVVNNTSDLSVAGSFDLSVPSGAAYYIGNPAYSPDTGYLYAAITSAGAGSSMLPPGLAAIGNCGKSMAWHAQFGPDSALYSGENPRSAPTVTAGGVVFMGTPCTANGSGGCGSPGALGGALWAVDAATGTVLEGGKPLVITTDDIRMAPSADGEWLYLLDDSGNFYGYTVDPSVPAVAAQPGIHVTSTWRYSAH